MVLFRAQCGLWFSLPASTSETTIIVCMPRSVLVVDDDPEFRTLAVRLLSASGLIVVGESDSVSAALSDASRLKPSAFLVDVELPDGDGVTLTRELARLPWRPRIVVTSIDGDSTTDRDVRRAGARAFVHKADLPNAPLAQLLGDE
jgi:DNA-binding NarL/FixJ family response regulator